jgi:ATP-dependent DNA helicase 2 subunit 2
VHPEEGLQPPAEILLRYSKPPEALIEQIKKQTDVLIKKADIKKGKTPK